MRILTVSNCPLQAHLGSGYVIKNFVEGLRALGHEVDVLEPADYEVLQFLRPRFSTHRQAVGMMAATRRQLRVKTYDMVEFWGGEAWLATRWLRSQGSRRPVIVQHTNGPEPRYASGTQSKAGRQSLQRLLSAGAFTHADAIVTVSEYDRQWLKGHPQFKQVRVETVEPALPAEMQDIPLVLRSPKRIGFCGSWIPRKGTAAVVEAFVRLRRDIPDLKLVLAGVGENFRVGDAFPSEVHDAIEVHPMIRDKARLREYYQGLSILILPSKEESFGLVIAEAMACGCAVVATPVGFASCLVDGEEVVLMGQDSAEQLHSKTLQLLGNSELRNRIAGGGWARTRTLRWSESARRLERFYQLTLTSVGR